MSSYSSKVNKIFENQPINLPECAFAIVASYLLGPNSDYCRQFAGNILTKDSRIFYVSGNKVIETRSNGALHSSNDKPSKITKYYYIKGIELTYTYYWHYFGKLHRNFGLPSCVDFDDNMNIIEMDWFDNGEQTYDESKPYPNHIEIHGEFYTIYFKNHNKSYKVYITYKNSKKFHCNMTRQDICKDIISCSFSVSDNTPKSLKKNICHTLGLSDTYID